jgi:hypothetical protein
MRHTVRDLSDDQWKVLNRLIPKPKRRSDGRGRLASGAETIAEDIFIKAVWSEATELKLLNNTSPKKTRRIGVQQLTIGSNRGDK